MEPWTRFLITFYSWYRVKVPRYHPNQGDKTRLTDVIPSCLPLHLFPRIFPFHGKLGILLYFQRNTLHHNRSSFRHYPNINSSHNISSLSLTSISFFNSIFIPSVFIISSILILYLLFRGRYRRMLLLFNPKYYIVPNLSSHCPCTRCSILQYNVKKVLFIFF